MSDLLTEAATQLSVKMNKLEVKRLGKCVIMVHGFLTYYGTLLVPTFWFLIVYGLLWFIIFANYGCWKGIRKEWWTMLDCIIKEIDTCQLKTSKLKLSNTLGNNIKQWQLWRWRSVMTKIKFEAAHLSALLIFNFIKTAVIYKQLIKRAWGDSLEDI